MLLEASDFMWHLLSSLPYTVWVVVEVFIFLEAVCDYGAKQQSIFRLNPTENEYLPLYCLHCISVWLRHPNVH